MSEDSDRDVALATAVEMLTENHQRIIEEQRRLYRQQRVVNGLLFIAIALLFVLMDEGAVYADVPWIAWGFGAVAAIVLIGVLYETLREAYGVMYGSRE